MNVVTALGILAAAVIGFLLGKKKAARILLPGSGDSSFFRTLNGSDGFCTGKVLKKRMKGRVFHWERVGGCRPAPGARFEIRLKDPSQVSPLIPAVPCGVDDIWADVKTGEPAGNVCEYSLWQVLANGSERELDDPELEIAEI